MADHDRVVPAARSHWVRRHSESLVAALVPMGYFWVIALLVLGTNRLLLSWQHAENLAAAGALYGVLRRGWRFDVVVASAACIVPVVAHWLAPARLLSSASWQRLSAAWLTCWLTLIVWNEAATSEFISEFGVRPNRLYLEYLGDWREVLPTLWGAHRTALLTGLALALGAAAAGWRIFHRPATPVPPWPLRFVALAPVALALFIGARGSTGHRPLSISFAASSANAIVNELALNSTYSALYALRQMRRETSILVPYGPLPRKEVVARVQSGMQLPASAFIDPAQPTAHLLDPTAQQSGRPNLVILLQESLGAHYFRSLGGEPVATELEKWRGRSLWFDQLYATGTRSARGLEAVVAGFLPTRSPSVLKLEGAQRDFFTVASALKAQGYYTEFIYGGDSSFDNMRRFFLGNGFDHVIDQDDLAPGAHFATTWGVSDEDLYARVHREVSRHAAVGQPYFALVFSTSNHPPYEFPPGRIEPYEFPSSTPRNAARYADFAAAAYLERAERSTYWKNTVFVVVADHESRTVGEGLVPVFSFHVPAFITGGLVRPRVISRLASQIDLVPTALSLMGARVRLPAPGLDYSRSDLTGPGRAIMQFHDTAAYRVGNDVVILAPGQAPRHFQVSGLRLVPAPPNEDLARQAIALTTWPIMAYTLGWYR